MAHRTGMASLSRQRRNDRATDAWSVAVEAVAWLEGLGFGAAEACAALGEAGGDPTEALRLLERVLPLETEKTITRPSGSATSTCRDPSGTGTHTRPRSRSGPPPVDMGRTLITQPTEPGHPPSPTTAARKGALRTAGSAESTRCLAGQPTPAQSVLKLSDWLPERAEDRSTPELPASLHRSRLLQLIRTQRVTIVSGETGSGKSTQIPQHIMDERDLVPDGKLVVVTQPRRLAAVSIAEHVASERGEEVGDHVGYQIRFDNRTSSATRLVYCTTAVLLRRLHCDPLLSRVAVLVVDEVHERDLVTEFLVLAVRARLTSMQHVRVVLMSASLSAATFAGFFSPEPSIFRIAGRSYPVREAFLEEVLEWTGVALPASQSLMALPSSQSALTELVIAVVCKIDAAAAAQGDSREGAILVFLPGLQDIQALSHALCKMPQLLVLPLHSLLAPEQQQRAFALPPAGRRKVVLSTDVAETSVTINDVDFVVNSGLAKERVHDPGTGLSDLEVVPNTRANVEQRRGRAGRLRPGACVHLFPRAALQRMQQLATPEILSRPLEEVVLQLVALRLGEPQAVLARAISKPEEEAVEDAVALLQAMGAISGGSLAERDGPVRLTPLGRFLALLPLHPMSAKVLLYGAKFGVLRPVAAVVALLNLRSPFTQRVEAVGGAGEEKGVSSSNTSTGLGAKAGLAPGHHSDHLALASALLGWARARLLGGVAAGDAFVAVHSLNAESLEMGVKLADTLVDAMVEQGCAKPALTQTGALCLQPEQLALFHLALCCGLAPQLAYQGEGGARTDRGEEVQFHSSSVNSSCLSEEAWAVYSDAVRLARANLMESTVVGAAHVIVGAQRVLVNPQSIGGPEVDLWLDGWAVRTSLGEAAEAGRLRQHLRQALLQGLQQGAAKAAATLEAELLSHLADFLRRGCTFSRVRGWRQPRAPRRERCTLSLRGLPLGCAAAEVEAHFSHFGRVVEVRVPSSVHDEQGQRCGGQAETEHQSRSHSQASAHVRFGSREAAIRALNHSPHELGGIRVVPTLARRQRRTFPRGPPPPKGAVELAEARALETGARSQAQAQRRTAETQALAEARPGFSLPDLPLPDCWPLQAAVREGEREPRQSKRRRLGLDDPAAAWQEAEVGTEAGAGASEGVRGQRARAVAAAVARAPVAVVPPKEEQQEKLEEISPVPSTHRRTHRQTEANVKATAKVEGCEDDDQQSCTEPGQFLRLLGLEIEAERESSKTEHSCESSLTPPGTAFEPKLSSVGKAEEDCAQVQTEGVVIRLRALLEDLSQQKLRAVEVEDFDTAANLKRKEHGAQVALAAVEEAAHSEDAQVVLDRLATAKVKAVTEEKYAWAAELRDAAGVLRELVAAR